MNIKKNSFWKSYFNNVNFLLKNYPNKKQLAELANLGPLERSHIDFLLAFYN